MSTVEIAESDAVGESAVIYAEIKAVFGVPVVNQIYRRLAPIPGALEWGWSLIREAWDSGALEEASSRILTTHQLGEPDPGFLEELARQCADPLLRLAVQDVLDTYNRSNPINLLAVAHLDEALAAGRHAPSRPSATRRVAVIAVPTLPAMVDLERCDPELCGHLLHLARLVPGDGAVVVPSLFRHFGRWPGFLALSVRGIAPLAQSGALALAAKAIEADAVAVIDDFPVTVSPSASAIPPPAGRDAESVAGLLHRFPAAISGMIVIGTWLRRALHRLPR